MINVLFIAGGKRCELAKQFIKRGCQLWAYESDPYAPISKYATIIRGLPFDKEEEVLTDLTINIAFNKIDIVIPCYDTVIPILSQITENTKLAEKIVVSPKKTSEICLDKSLFEKFMVERFPDYYPSVDGYGDIIAKLKFGCGSKGIKIYSENESRTYKRQDDYIYQKFIIGEEYTVDGYINRQGECLCCVPRKREYVLGGEVVNSSIVWDERLINLTEKIGLELGCIGPYGIQYIIEENTNKIYIIECNSRFNGGSTFSIAAGCDMINWIIQEYYYGNKVKKEDVGEINKNLILRRCFSDYFFTKQ